MFLLGAFASISDVSGRENRTLRMAFIEGILVLGLGLGNSAGDKLYANHGFVPVYTLASIVAVISLICTIFLHSDPNPDKSTSPKKVKTRLKISSVLTRVQKANINWYTRLKIAMSCCLQGKLAINCRPTAVRKLAILPAYGRLLRL
jgi:hypothetical protein